MPFGGTKASRGHDRRRRRAGLAAALLALLWVGAPAQACLTVLAHVAPSGPAATGCADCDAEATGRVAGGHGSCETGGCMAEAMPPCPAETGQPVTGWAPTPGPMPRSGMPLRLAAGDPLAGLSPPSLHLPDDSSLHLRSCVLLI